VAAHPAWSDGHSPRAVRFLGFLPTITARVPLSFGFREDVVDALAEVRGRPVGDVLPP
jgi:hypothetical protein